MITPNVPWQDYLQVRKMNPSTIVAGCYSMLRLKRAIDGGFPEESKAMRLGSGCHALLLEPEQFESRFCVMPDFHLDAENLRAAKNKSETVEDRRTTSKATSYYSQKAKAFQAENQGKTIISRSDYDTALMCIESIRSRPNLAELLEDAICEVTVEGEIDGVPFKGRIDALRPDTITDLKTTRSVHRRQFGWQCLDLEYPFKMAIYRELVRQNTVGVREVKIIAQELQGDFDNARFTIPSDLLDEELVRVRKVIERYKIAREQDYWPGVDGGEYEVELELPYRKDRDKFDFSGVLIEPDAEQEEIPVEYY